MADKDLLEVIAEMLHKQDQQSELIAQTNTSLIETNSRIMETNDRIMETNDILKEFMGVSIKQWDEQHKFNERLYTKVDSIEKQIIKLADLEDRVKRIESILFKGS